MTDETTTRPEPTQPPTRRGLWPHLELSGTQLAAAALAAVTATIAGSYLGVSGTVIGAALASVLTAVGNAVYGHSLRSTRDRVREVVPVGRFAPRTGPPLTTMATRPAVRAEQPPVLPMPAPRLRAPGRWRSIAIGAVTVFAAVLAVVTSIEIVAGRPLSDLLRGNDGTGTSVFGASNQTQQGGGSGATPTVTKTVIPLVVVTTPTVTQTAPAVTKTATPTATATTTSTPTAPVTSPAATASAGSAGSTSAP
ncbi:MAG: hypothetical protein QOG01_1793 [Pseudonocardiales bacterium]|jgi:hypothetical protein|nr:hypothetical protein [Pseudonocardiales bacterium]